ncbi:patatin-domain-containing protein [Neoconidiobolus thromboides FSU 785]|nr:patatin-domain-containing protein [Neoconidiobolus thromboides FSU 785]
MASATNFEQWASAASLLDQYEGKNDWKNDPTSEFYDYELLHSRLTQLRKARAENDYHALIYLLRTSLSRNFADMGNPALYSQTNVGTKVLIEVYINEVVSMLNMLADANEEILSTQAKYELFLNIRQALGRTALLLSGGATLGINHFGICRALNEVKLLPRIISGASSGSIVASVLCTRTDAELDKMLLDGDMNMTCFEDITEEGVIIGMLSRLLKRGILFNVDVLLECLQELIGDYTFQEAYNKTRRILNIPVSSSTVYEMPRLLNYVTAPNVLIWSAVAASCSVPLFFDSTTIYAKDRQGNKVPWNPTGKWIDGSVENDLPMNKLSEMFNVNHFIVCQVNPHVIPFLKTAPSTTKIAKFVDWMMYFSKAELLHRVGQLSEIGIMKETMYKIQSIISQKYVGDITIVPSISAMDFLKIFSNPSQDEVYECLSRGEKAIWPKISIIRNHCHVELCIDQIIYRLRLKLFAQSYNSSIPLSIDNNNNNNNNNNGMNYQEDNENEKLKPIPRSASSSQFLDQKKKMFKHLSTIH